MYLVEWYKNMGIRGRLVMLMLASNLLLLVALFTTIVPILGLNLTKLWDVHQLTLVDGMQIPLKHVLGAIATGFVLVGSIVMLISWIALRSITRPIADFTEHLQTIGEKHGAERLFHCNHLREICRLATSFNHMILESDQQNRIIKNNFDKLHEQTAQLEEEIVNRQRAEDELQLFSEQYRITALLLQSICDNVPDLIWAKDLQHRYIFSNKANNETLLFPKTPDEPIGKTHDHFANPEIASHPDDPLWYCFSDMCAKSDANTLATGQPMRFQEYGFVRGERICLDVYKAPLHDAKGTLIGTIGSARIITREQQLEVEAIKLNRLFRVLSSINTLIVRRPEPDELYHEVCRIAVDEGGFSAAWLGRPLENGVVQPIVTCGALTLEQLDELSTEMHTTGCEAILEHALPYIRSDISASTKQLLCPACLRIYQHHHFRSLASYPIIANNNAVLVLTLYSPEPDFFDAAEQRLLQELCGDIGYAIEVYQLNQTQQFLANYDLLTGLPNRTMLGIQLEHAIAQVKREDAQLALLHVDLDRFKELNESYGHAAGDDLLKQAAARLSARLRQTDMISRPGGDEFMVVLDTIDDPQDSARVAAEIMAILSDPFELMGGVTITISASIGIAMFPDHGNNPHDLLQNVDSALSLAKKEGKNCFRFYSEKLTFYARERLELEAKLRLGIQNNELQVFFQPQIDIATNSIIGAEALVRWNSPEMGLVSPAHFIPIAEETGLIVKLGEYVLRETCRLGTQWLKQGLPRITLAVNLSPLQLRQASIVTTVQQVLEETAYPVELLELEVTESALMEHGDKALEILNSLRNLGLQLAMDDFGTGYSSLAYLKYFPLSLLKIDKTFVDDLPDDPNDQKIVTTIVQMGQQLGFKVLAEGVEREEQLQFLQALGCDLYQGYLSSKPISPEAFYEFVRSSIMDSK